MSENNILSSLGVFTTKTDQGYEIDKTKHNLQGLDQELISKINVLVKNILSLDSHAGVGALEYLTNDLKIEIATLKTEINQVKLTQTKTATIFKKNREQEISLKAANKLLVLIEERLETVELKDIAYTTLIEKNTSLSDESKKILNKLVPVFINNLLNKVKSQIFRGWSRNLKEKKEFYQKVPEFQTKIRELSIEIESIRKQKMELIKNNGDRKGIEELNTKQLENIETLEEVKNQFSLLLQTQHLGKSYKTRKEMEMLGGQPLKIDDKASSSILDGMYLSADRFRSKLKDAGAKVCELKFNDPDGSIITGLKFSSENYEKSFKDIFSSFRLLEPNSEWIVLKNTSDEFLIIPKEDFQIKAAAHAFIEDEREIETTEKVEGGTVLLTSGNAGVYEMHKEEVLSFLLKGMNVMTCNFSGYGDSTGEPSETNLKSNMIAMYAHLKTTYNTPDEKILLKALCMSGGPATYLAAEHPNVNLLLDQSYSNFTEVVGNEIKDKIGLYFDKLKEKKIDIQKLDKLKGSILDWAKKNSGNISYLISKLIAPSWEVSKEISKINGKVGLLVTENDTMMEVNKEYAKKNREALSKAEKQCDLMSMPGEHADSWLQSSIKNNFQINYTIFTNEMYNSELTYLDPDLINRLLSDIQVSFKKHEGLNDIEINNIVVLALDNTELKLNNEEKEKLRLVITNSLNWNIDYPGQKHMQNFLARANLLGNLFA